MEHKQIYTFSLPELETLLAAASARALEDNGGAEFSQREMRKKYGRQFDDAVAAGLKPCHQLAGKKIYRISDFLKVRAREMRTARILAETLR